ncbi:MAG: glucose 1-dehydrogenase [Deltaproteobacteria bacterium]|nr:glucose 1-dehydrogenase [Deltaproteobacteria bacterium]
MSGRLEGKVAVITGGSRGIGAAIAEAFVREGAQVVISSRKQEGLDASARHIASATGRPDAISAFVCHTGDPAQVAALFDHTRSRFGIATIAVNNAATNPHFGPMLSLTSGAWDKTFEVNTRGYFEVARHAAEGMIEGGLPGSIINITSIMGMRAAVFQGIYGMTKAAVISMTQTLAMELGGRNIRVNAIAPGLVETKFASILIETPEIAARFNERSAIGRVAQPEELAGAALFLASNESSYVTGQTLAVDGGYTIA